MNRFSLIVACLTLSAPLMIANATQAAPMRGRGGSRPAAGLATPSRSSGHAHATPARLGNVHPGTARTGNTHAGASHAKSGANHANSAKANHSQANNGKARANQAGQGNGQRGFPGRGFRGFSASNWLPAFGIYSYYNPDDSVWYYWYEPSEMYLPASYINDYPPPTGSMQR